jgi:alanine dehydrogenase
MLIGTPREVIPGERRVGLTPQGAHCLKEAGHEVLLEAGAGEGSGHSDTAYMTEGAGIVSSPEELWGRAELVTKVKQPVPEEVDRFREGLTLFSYCHLATRPWLVDALLQRRVTAIAFEEVQLANGTRPLLRPMSEIAGRLAVLIAGQYLAAPHGSRGVLLGSFDGRPAARVLILGGGAAGSAAAAAAHGLGAAVSVVDRDPDSVRSRIAAAAPGAEVLQASREMVERLLPDTDAVINAIRWDPLTGSHLITRDALRRLPHGAVIVDIDCTPGGAVETSRTMTVDSPVFEVEGVIHHCVPNMPATVPLTSTEALTSATLPYLERLATLGVDGALEALPELGPALQCRSGRLLDEAVARATGQPFGDQGDAP